MLVIDRRTFIGGSLALGTFARPRPTSGQLGPKVARIGILGFSGTAADMVGPEPTRPSVKAFLLGLRELGYVYGRDFVTEVRAGEGRPELWPAMAAESESGDAQAGHHHDPDRHDGGLRPCR
jgi:hypothetical protein